MPATQLPADPRAIRERLVKALRLDLVGPRAGHELDAEQLPGRARPSNWYVAGFLIPTGIQPEAERRCRRGRREAVLERNREGRTPLIDDEGRGDASSASTGRRALIPTQAIPRRRW